MKQTILSILLIIALLFGFVKLVQMDIESTQGCIDSGHSEDFCKYGIGPRY